MDIYLALTFEERRTILRSLADSKDKDAKALARKLQQSRFLDPRVGILEVIGPEEDELSDDDTDDE